MWKIKRLKFFFFRTSFFFLFRSFVHWFVVTNGDDNPFSPNSYTILSLVLVIIMKILFCFARLYVCFRIKNENELKFCKKKKFGWWAVVAPFLSKMLSLSLFVRRIMIPGQYLIHLAVHIPVWLYMIHLDYLMHDIYKVQNLLVQIFW